MNSNTDEEVSTTNQFLLQELPLNWNWKWMAGLGVIMLILGTMGLLASSILTLTSVLMFGGFIFAGGIIQITQTIQEKDKEWGGRLQHFLIAILYIIAGMIIFWDPFTTSVILTLFLASLFAVIGATRILYAFYCRKQDWKWLLPASVGLLDLIVTIIVIATLPESAFWLIGTLIAIEMLMNGWFILLLGLGVRKAENN